MRCQVVFRRGRFNTTRTSYTGYGPGLTPKQTVITIATSTPPVPLLTGWLTLRLDNVAGFMEIGLLDRRLPTVPELSIMSLTGTAVSKLS